MSHPNPVRRIGPHRVMNDANVHPAEGTDNEESPLMKSRLIVSRHNPFSGAVWTAVSLAGKTQHQRFQVVKEPGRKRWLVVRQTRVPGTPWRSWFTVKSFSSGEKRNQACADALEAIDQWRAATNREIAAGNTRTIPRGSSILD